jgi:agmatine deiminase
MNEERSTPRDDGFSMPAEWDQHQACYMEWPTLTRRDFWAERFEDAKRDYAEVANAIAAFEPVVMVCDPDQQAEARRHCGEGVEILPLPIDDSWMRDNGPIFVRDGEGRVALVHFRFNSWGEKFLPYDRDARVPRHIAAHLGMRRYEAPFVLEGGSFFVDGEGTLLTTEQCLLNPNRNPTLKRTDIERLLRDSFGVREILWLGDGIEGDDTDGHIDDLTRFVAPGAVVTVMEPNRADANHAPLTANRRLLDTLRVGGKPLTVVELPMPTPQYLGEQRLPASYANFYVANGAVLVPTFGCPADDAACGILRECFPRRRVVAIDCRVLIAGLGALHCLTQQVPAVATS